MLLLQPQLKHHSLHHSHLIMQSYVPYLLLLCTSLSFAQQVHSNPAKPDQGQELKRLDYLPAGIRPDSASDPCPVVDTVVVARIPGFILLRLSSLILRLLCHVSSLRR